MTKITVDTALIEQALNAIELNWKSDEGDAVKPLLRAALKQPAVGPITAHQSQTYATPKAQQNEEHNGTND